MEPARPYTCLGCCVVRMSACFNHMYIENYIDGEEFFCLTEDKVKEIVPVIGIAKKIFRLRQMVCLK